MMLNESDEVFGEIPGKSPRASGASGASAGQTQWAEYYVFHVRHMPGGVFRIFHVEPVFLAHQRTLEGLHGRSNTMMASPPNYWYKVSCMGGKAQAAVFKSLGISTKSLNEPGKLKGTDALLTEVAEAFSKMEDGARKSNLATELFGKSGLKLIPVLNKGAAGLDELRQEAARLNLVFGDEAIAAGQAFGNSLGKLGQAFLPAAQAMVEIVTDLIGQYGNLIKIKVAEWANKLVKVLPGLKE